MVKDYVIRKRNLLGNISKLYVLIWGQCLDGLQSTIRLYKDFEVKSSQFDGMWLLKIIEENMVGIHKSKNVTVQLRKKLIYFLLTRQYEKESLNNYLF